MKKLLVGFIVSMIVVTGVAVTTSRALTTVGEDGFAVPASAGISHALESGGEDAVDLVRVEYEDVVYSAWNGFYVGEERKAVDLAFPIYINNGAGLRFLNEENWLVSSEVDLLPTFEGLYLNDGYTYNGDMEQADAEEFVFLILSNGLYMNAQGAVFANPLDRREIPVNSILLMDESGIRWFEPAGGALVYQEETAVFNATLTVGSNVYDYHDLLDALGMIREAIELRRDGEDTTPLEEEILSVLNIDSHDGEASASEMGSAAGTGEEADGGHDAGLSQEPEQGDDGSGAADAEAAGEIANDDAENEESKDASGDVGDEDDAEGENGAGDTEDGTKTDADKADAAGGNSIRGGGANSGATARGGTANDTRGGATPSGSAAAGSGATAESGAAAENGTEAGNGTADGASGSAGGAGSSSGNGSSTGGDRANGEADGNGSGDSVREGDDDGANDGTSDDKNRDSTPKSGDSSKGDIGTGAGSGTGSGKTGTGGGAGASTGRDREGTGTDDQSDVGEGGELPYRDPEVHFDELEAWSYALAGNLTLIDDVNAIQRGVRITVYSRISGSGGSNGEKEGHKTYPADRYSGKTTLIRKTYQSGQELTLSPLPPDTTIYAQLSYRYTREIYTKDENGNETRETMRVNEYSDLVELKTPSVSAGGVQAVSADWTAVYAASSASMQLNGLKLRNTSAYVADTETFDFENFKLDTLPYVSSMVYTLTPKGGGDKVTLTAGPSLMTRAQTDGGVTFTSAQTLEAAKEYDFTVKAYDRYSNELPLAVKGDTKIYTSKRVPTVTIRETTNEADSYAVSLTVSDPDGALSKDSGGAPLPLVFRALDKAQAAAELSGTLDGAAFDAGDSRTLELSGPMDGKTYNIVIDSFDYGTNYTLMADGSYDPQPDIAGTPATLPRVTDVTLGRLLAFTAPLSSGSVYFTSYVDNVLDTSAAINLTMTNRTTTDILPLVDAFYVVVRDMGGNEVSRTELLASEFDKDFGTASFDDATESVTLRAGTRQEARIRLLGQRERYRNTNPWQSLLIHATGEEDGNVAWSSPMRLEVQLPAGTLQSSTRYLISVESAVIKAEIHQIPTTLSITSFTTKKVQPEVRREDLFIAGGELQFINMYIYDPDGTIGQGGLVYADLFYGSTRLQRKTVYATTHEPGENGWPGYAEVRFTDIVPENQYTLKLVAAEFNDAEGYSSLVLNKTIAEWNEFSAEKEYLSGRLDLTSLDYASKLGAENVFKRFVYTGTDEGPDMFLDTTAEGAEAEHWSLNSSAAYTTPVYALPEGTTFLQLSGYYPATGTAYAYFYKNAAGTTNASTASRSCDVSGGNTPLFTVPSDAQYVKLLLPGGKYLRSNGVTLLTYQTAQADLITGSLTDSAGNAIGDEGTKIVENVSSYNATTGAVTTNSSYNQLHMLPVTPGQLYVRADGSGGASVAFWGATGAIFGTQAANANAAFVIPDKVSYISVAYTKSSSDASGSNNSFYLVADASPEDGFTARAGVSVNDRYGYLKTNVPVTVKLEVSDTAELPNYREYATFTPQSFTLSDASAGGTRLYTLLDEVTATNLPANKGWRMTLGTTYRGAEVTLHSITVRTDAAYGLIRCNEDLYQITKNPYGNYLVTQPFEHTRYVNVTPYGVLDFNGQQITRKTEAGADVNLINTNRGVIRNLTYVYPADCPEGGHIMVTNNGVIDNLVIRTEGARTIRATAQNLAMTNNNGTVRNFIVRLGGDLHLTSASAAGIVALFGNNRGIIEDGYIYGVDGAGLIMYPQEGNVSSGLEYTMIAYQYYPTDIVRNVFALYDTWIMTSASGKMVRTGSMISRSQSGRAENLYQVGDFYDYDGPGAARSSRRLNVNRMFGELGMAGNARNIHLVTPNNYDAYISNLKFQTDRYQVLADKEWQHNVLQGDAFEIDKWVEMGFYPRLKLNTCMEKYQDYLPLPTESIKQAPVLVEDGWASDYGYDAAQYGHDHSGGFIVLRFRNDSNVTIRDVTFAQNSAKKECLELVSYAGTTHVYRAEYADDGLYNVVLNVRVPEDGDYLSAYTVKEFTYSAGAADMTPPADYTTRNISFWKEIADEQGWSEINRKMGWNYVLTQDIYFNQLKEPAIRINGSETALNATTTFTGKLDGNGKALHNVNLLKIAEPSVFHALGTGAEVKNLIVDGMVLEGVSSTEYCGFIRTGAHATVENVHIRNARLSSSGSVGALLAQQTGGTWVTACSAANCVLDDINSNLTLNMGGLIGNLGSQGYAERCYVRDLTATVDNASVVNGVGGVVGNAAYSGLYDCYATGAITASANNVGGIIGSLNTAEGANRAGRFWSEVELDVNGGFVGGIVGKTSVGVAGSMAVGSILATSASNVHRVAGGGVYSPTSEYYRQNYAYSGQSVSGVKAGERDYAVALFGTAQMRTPAVWVDSVGLRDAWDCSVVAEGHYPILLDKNGERIYGQEGNWIDMPSGVEYSLSATGTTTVDINDSSKVTYTVQADMSHEGMDNSGNTHNVTAVLDGMVTDGKVTITGYDGYTRIKIVTDKNDLQKAKDFYRLDVMLDGKRYSTQVDYGGPVYWEIDSIGAWNNILSTGHGTQNENFRITGPVDFDGETTPYSGLMLNRLEGPAGRTMEEIKAGLEGMDRGENVNIPGFFNLNYTAGEDGECWIKLVANKTTGLAFDTITADFSAAAQNCSTTGVIANGYGILDCVIRNVKIIVNANTGTRCGFMGTNNQNSRNIWLEKVTLCASNDNVNVGKSYAGALCGYTIGAFPNVSGKDVTVNLKGQTYVGGLAGYVYWDYTEDGGNISYGEYTGFHVSGYNAVGGLFGQHLRQIGRTASGTTPALPVVMRGSADDDPFTVEATGGYAGGVVGYNYQTMQNIEVQYGRIIGLLYAGGFCGYEHGAANSNIRVLDCEVRTSRGDGTSTASYAGGLYGYDNSGTSTTNCRVERTAVSGNHAVGGLIGGKGGTGTVSNCQVADSTVKNMESSTNSTTNGNSSAGGLVGYADGGTMYSISTGTVRNTLVSGRTRVGGVVGLLGSTGRAIDRCFVAEDVTVTAAFDKAGGAVGAAYEFIITNCAVGAPVTVEGSGGKAGGILGYAYANGVNRVIQNSYYVGEVTSGGKYASGVIGHVDDAKYLTAGNLSNILVAATVSGSDESKTSLWLNDNTNLAASSGDGTVYIWKKSVMNGKSAESMAASYEQAYPSRLVAVMPTSGALLDAADFNVKTTYTGKGFTANTKWNLSKLETEGNKYMPYPTLGDNNGTILTYANKATNGDEKGIPLPNPTGYNPGETVVYASGVDCVNIESSARTITVKVGTSDAKQVTLNENGVATVPYNFVSELVVDGTTYTAAQLRRTVLTWGTGPNAYWYYIDLNNGTDKGEVKYGDAKGQKGYLNGLSNVVHLWQGKALTEIGQVYDLTAGSATSGDYKEGETRPFWHYSDGATGVDVYYNFTLYGNVKLDATRLFILRYTPSGGSEQRVLHSVSPYQDVTYDGMLYTETNTATTSTLYFAMLNSAKHMIENYGPTILSTNWYNGRIDHISNSMGYDAPVVVIRYDDGVHAAVVNYATNELIDGIGAESNLPTKTGLSPTSLRGFVRNALSNLLGMFTGADNSVVPTVESYLTAVEEAGGTEGVPSGRKGGDPTADGAGSKEEEALGATDGISDEAGIGETDGTAEGGGVGDGVESPEPGGAEDGAEAEGGMNTDGGSSAESGANTENGDGAGDGALTESADTAEDGGIEEGTSAEDGAVVVNDPATGNDPAIASGAPMENGAAVEDGAGSADVSGTDAEAGTAAESNADAESGATVSSGDGRQGSMKQFSLEVASLFSEQTDAMYIEGEGLYAQDGRLLQPAERLTYDSQRGLYVGGSLAYKADRDGGEADGAIAMVSLARQEQDVLNALGNTLVMFDPYTGAYGAQGTVTLLEGGGRSGTQAEEAMEEAEEGGSTFEISSAMGRRATEREQSGFTWLAVIGGAGVILLAALWFRLRKKKE